MATVFIQTNEGMAHDHAVRMGRATPSGIAAIICYTGTPVTDVVDIKGLTASTAGSECYRISEENIPQTDVSAVSTLLEPELPEQLTGLHITAFGYLLKNGVLWGYAPYRPDKGGLVKDNTFSLAMKLICTSTDSPTVTVEYSSLDLRELRRRLLEDVRNELNIPQLASLLHDALKLCIVDGNDNGFSIDGGNPEPACQIIPIDQQLNAVDGGTL